LAGLLRISGLTPALAVIFLLLAGTPSTHAAASEHHQSSRAQWMYEGGYGLSTHYSIRPGEDPTQVVKRFKPKKIAEQMAKVGAGWLIFPVHHQHWRMAAPNATYDRIAGTGEYTADVDLPARLIEALAAHDIKLVMYVNVRLDPRSNCPKAVREGMGGWPPSDTLIRNLARVYRTFSQRYGEGVAGWWVDGTWLPGYQNQSKSQRKRWFTTLAEAFRAGHPDAAVAFNPGKKQHGRYAWFNDYFSGESIDLSRLPASRFRDGAQWHVWTYLGNFWAVDGTRYSTDRVIDYTKKVMRHDGILTFEVGTRGWRRSNRREPIRDVRSPGTIDPKQIKQLQAVQEATRPIVQARD
jgi:hypothetical protein